MSRTCLKLIKSVLKGAPGDCPDSEKDCVRFCPRAIALSLLVIIATVCRAYLGYASIDPVRLLAEAVFLSSFVTVLVTVTFCIGCLLQLSHDAEPIESKPNCNCAFLFKDSVVAGE